jgi:hypothetical protein
MRESQHVAQCIESACQQRCCDKWLSYWNVEHGGGVVSLKTHCPECLAEHRYTFPRLIDVEEFEELVREDDLEEDEDE